MNQGSFGPNAWLIDEMYEKYCSDPNSVALSWRDFFSDYNPMKDPAGNISTVGSGEKIVQKPVFVASPEESKNAELPRGVEVLTGISQAIARNMNESLSVPTATSVRSIPAKLLEVNRSILNRYLTNTSGLKVSFTHIIAYAIAKALNMHPQMAMTYLEGDPPAIMAHEEVGLGIAVDTKKADGSRTLMVPCIKNANKLEFSEFIRRYDDLVHRAASSKLTLDDLTGVVVTVTNPGTLGTEHSVPRLLKGQSAIIGVGAIEYPKAFSATNRERLADLAIGPEIVLTSTYDHRVIQGALSGEFLRSIEDLLLGKNDFYTEIFRSLKVVGIPMNWSVDVSSAGAENREEKVAQVRSLVNMYRVRGHLLADLDPLHLKTPQLHPELDLSQYGLTIWDLDRRFKASGVKISERPSLGEILDVLHKAYCEKAGIEYMHIQNPEEKTWIQEKVEKPKLEFSKDESLYLLGRLNRAEAFEKFLHTRYVGQKRFGLEGAEAAIVILDAVFNTASANGTERIVMGMAHRGRLNVLANIVGKSLKEIFKEFEGQIDPDSVQGSGDVKYHKGATGIYISKSKKELKVNLVSNPSHLEAVDPVVEGLARALQECEKGGDPKISTVAVLIHGDAAFAGQGVVAETLNLSQLPGYKTGGTIHLIINNQLGFTTSPETARSSPYATDVAKTVQAPIFHVNGDDPEECYRIGQLALEFRNRFKKDVVIDMFCYRLHGHNELDDPSFTQPIMYKAINAKRSVRKIYTENLVSRGVITLKEAEESLEEFSKMLSGALEETRETIGQTPKQVPAPVPVKEPDDVNTSIGLDTLEELAEKLHAIPAGFHIHPRLEKVIASRFELYKSGEIDWSLSEALSYASIAKEKFPVRVSGQDTRRGTFSHRHGVWIDYETAQEYYPIEFASGNSLFKIYDSSLSEYAALGFEYGYSLGNRNALVVWEAQFGDFSNGAQIVIDNFIAAAEDKWDQTSSLVLLLPHGYEGQGPEHSSARLERFLSLCANANMLVVQPTTAAQFFHIIRYQVLTKEKKPLIVMSPKYLLRAKASRSPISAFTAGNFMAVVDDEALLLNQDADIKRLLFCSGKIAFELMDYRERHLKENGEKERYAGTKIIRLERLYPFPKTAIKEILEKYKNADQIYWVQEEPDNMGAWPFIGIRFIKNFGIDPKPVSRRGSGSPATGSSQIHMLEQEMILRRAFE
jgi:2-oxoglutarate decarboxylase